MLHQHGEKNETLIPSWNGTVAGTAHKYTVLCIMFCNLVFKTSGTYYTFNQGSQVNSLNNIKTKYGIEIVWTVSEILPLR